MMWARHLVGTCEAEVHLDTYRNIPNTFFHRIPLLACSVLDMFGKLGHHCIHIRGIIACDMTNLCHAVILQITRLSEPERTL